MSDRTVKTRLVVEWGQFKAGMTQAGSSVDGFTKKVTDLPGKTKPALTQLEESARKNREAWTQAGIVVGGVGAGMVAAFAVSARAAINWESAFAGVLKTVDGTPVQLAAIEDGLRALARELPESHAEIAAVAEAAGQLGVQTDSVVEFTKVMVELGDTTNLSSEEAATAIAQLMNIMQTAPADVERLGSTLVDLGNNGASTEAQIVEMAQRIAGAGELVGLTEAQVLGIANAVASTGTEVELGGTAISQTLAQISKAVSEGGSELVAFAQTAGMTTSEFSDAFNRDPAQAITAFVAGLGRVQEQGGNTFATLDKAGLQGARIQQTLLKLSGAGDLLTTSLQQADAAWSENNALQEEARKRYETTAAQLEITKNKITDAAIEVGTAFLPAINAAASAVGDLAGGVGDLPGPLRNTLAVVTLLGGAVAVTAGGFLILAPRIAATRAALETMPRAARAATTTMKALGGAATALTVAFAVSTLLDGIRESARDASPPVEDLTRDLLSLKDAGQLTGVAQDLADIDTSLSRIDTGGLVGFLDDVEGFGDKFGLGGLFRSGWLDILQSKDLDSAREDIDALDMALANLVTAGRSDLAASTLENFGKAAGLTDEQMARLRQELDAYDGALATGAVSAETASDGIQLVGMSAEDSTAAIDALTQAMEDLNNSFADDRAQITYRAKLDDLKAQFKDLTTAAKDETAAQKRRREAQLDGARALDTNTEAGRQAKSTLLDMIEAGAKHAEEVLKATGSTKKYNAVLARHREEIQEVADKLGIPKRKVRELLTEYDKLKPSITTKVKADVDSSELDAYLAKLKILDQNDPSLSYKHRGLPVPKKKRADGGAVSGPGGPRDDMVPIWASNGEYVISAKAVDKYGMGMFDALNAGRFADGGMVGAPRFASGGTVNVSEILSAWREAVGIIGREERDRIRQDARDAKQSVSDAKRARRDARRDVRDTKENNADRLTSAQQAVTDARTALGKAKTFKQQKQALDDLEAAKKDLKRTRRNNREDLENSNHRLRESEKDLKKARKESKEATEAATKADADYAAGKINTATQLGTALGKDIKDTDTFLRNINTLASRGYTDLAGSILASGDEQLAADAVKLTDSALSNLNSQVQTSQAQQDKLASLPTVFQILSVLSQNPNAGIAEVAFRSGLDMQTVEYAAATAKDLFTKYGTFSAELARYGFADGGAVTGVGSWRQDNILARLSVGEHVMSAQTVARNGGHRVFDALNDGTTMITGSGAGARIITIAPVLAPRFYGVTDVAEIEARIEGVAARTYTDLTLDLARAEGR